VQLHLDKGLVGSGKEQSNKGERDHERDKAKQPQLNGQILLDLLSCGQEKSSEDRCHQQHKGDQGDEQV